MEGRLCREPENVKFGLECFDLHEDFKNTTLAQTSRGDIINKNCSTKTPVFRRCSRLSCLCLPALEGPLLCRILYQKLAAAPLKITAPDSCHHLAGALKLN